jgi:hypothetical protein
MVPAIYFEALLAIASLACPAVAIAFPAPRPTIVNRDKAIEGRSPRPTPAPRYGYVRVMEREEVGVNTCGWINGHAGKQQSVPAWVTTRRKLINHLRLPDIL